MALCERNGCHFSSSSIGSLCFFPNHFHERSPISRSINQMQGTQTQILVASRGHHPGMGEEESWGNGRMDLESNDYPGSGANNRHLPRPPNGRG
ncbi:hypothetical protein Scep_017324 [Stephania cephalantha]|uniref:Uncharacterized protein n=1 Tax=Stephania cephalantha TaxID=152367 RepID=A0AAP0NWT6_9MAGN